MSEFGSASKFGWCAFAPAPANAESATKVAMTTRARPMLASLRCAVAALKLCGIGGRRVFCPPRWVGVRRRSMKETAAFGARPVHAGWGCGLITNAGSTPTWIRTRDLRIRSADQQEEGPVDISVSQGLWGS